MVSATATDLITVEQFDEMVLPDVCEWELVDGTVVSVTFPNRPHGDMQDRLAEIFKRLYGSAAIVRVEYPYTLGNHEKHRADVAVVAKERHAACPKHLDGAPEITVEVLSRSNLPYKVDDLETDCLREGAFYFWRINLKLQTVTIADRSGLPSRVYELDDVIPINLFGVTGHIDVNDLFPVEEQ